MLTYILDKSEKRTLTKQLYEGIKRDILTGKLLSGEKLPSKRVLSQNLKISVITVENAYEQLLAEGYITSRQRSGYYVSRIDARPSYTEDVTPCYDQSPDVGTETPVVMDFRTNRICDSGFPCTVMSRIMRQVLAEKRGLLEPLEFSGVKELREAIARYLYRFREISVSPDQIVVGAGTEYLYHLIIQLLGRDKCYALETPGYNKIARIYGCNNVDYRYLPVDKEGISAEHLQSTDAHIIHISPSHHFPTGVVMSIGRRQELLRWAEESEDRYVIEDDYDSEFRFSGQPIPPLYSMDAKKVIYINTFSKSITPAVRISYMILPQQLMEKYKRNMSFYSCSVSGIDQYMLARFISEGYFERHINRMRTQYRAKRDGLINALKESSFSTKITISEENAGLHFLMKIKTRISDREFARRAESLGLRVAFLSEYMQEFSEEAQHTMVVNYSGMEEENLPQAMQILADVLDIKQ